MRHRSAASLPPLLATLLCVGALVVLAPGRASAFTLDLQYGGTRLSHAGDGDWLSSLRVSGGVALAGPLEIGGYLHIHGRSFPLMDTGTGGGALVALRPRLPGVPLRLLLEGSAGRARIPVVQGQVNGWATALAVGLGVHLSEAVSFEARVMHTWHHRARALSDAWTFSGGFSFRLF
jgi:hypothetical protein